jgi:hypothetical protein
MLAYSYTGRLNRLGTRYTAVMRAHGPRQGYFGQLEANATL